MKARVLSFSKEYLHECFLYNQYTGTLTWRIRPISHFCTEKSWLAFNRKCPGIVAGSMGFQSNGDKAAIRIDVSESRGVQAHRIIWIMHNGSIPDGMIIDHKDGNPWNNRFENLRLATKSQNNQNTRIRKDNSTGYKGVCYIKKSDSYLVQVRINGARVYSKRFKNLVDAVSAYSIEAEKHHGEFKRQTK